MQPNAQEKEIQTVPFFTICGGSPRIVHHQHTIASSEAKLPKTSRPRTLTMLPPPCYREFEKWMFKCEY